MLRFIEEREETLRGELLLFPRRLRETLRRGLASSLRRGDNSAQSTTTPPSCTPIHPPSLLPYTSLGEYTLHHTDEHVPVTATKQCSRTRLWALRGVNSLGDNTSKSSSSISC